MPNLFLKIFLWFWFGMSIVMCVFFSVTHVPVRANRALVQSLSIPDHAQRISEIFETYGPQEFVNRFHDFQKPFHGAWYFFDQDGKELQGEAVPVAVLKIERAAAADDQTQYVTSSGHQLLAQRAISSTGRHYVLVRDLNYSALDNILTAARQIEGPQFVAVLLCSMLVSFWLAHRITVPVRKLRTAAEQLASGNLAARVSGSAVDQHDEIAQLSRDFNSMAQRIESLVSSQRRLITDISHELRSPLARLSIALGLARKHANYQIIGDLDRIERESERLNDLIGNLLELYRIEGRAAFPEDKQLVALDELVDEIAADVDYEAQSHTRGVRILHTEPCSILGIPELVHSAIENIVRNGIRYTKPGTEVEISLQVCRDEGGAVIHVRDHGDGVPPEDLQNIFRPFFRVQGARERSSGGTGLGLAITERSVQLHGGSVKAKNAQGGGLIVELWFPVLSPDSPAPYVNARLPSHA
jgi:signal transduction histidine kinase